MSRRALLQGGLVGAAGLVLSGCDLRRFQLFLSGDLPGVGHQPLRTPDSLPYPFLPAGTDTLPQIDHIVVVMLENHSYDNILGSMGNRGDGFAFGRDGRPTASNPGPGGEVVHAFPMPNACQQQGHPYNTWDAGHASYDGGAMDGFVLSQSGPVSMGYEVQSTLPFTYSLAQTFPVCDRYFASVLAQTYPNRRYLMAATSLGQVADTLNATERPPNGTIFESLEAHGITWKNYYSSLPTVGIWTYLLGEPQTSAGLANISQFYTDAAAGSLPGFSIVDPDFGTQSEEDPQDVQYGEQFLAQVVNAVMSGPGWAKTLLVWTYDEGGGYYDHVPPPSAVEPDSVPPQITVPPDLPGAFNRYGFRVPAGVVSPYAIPDYVSHFVHDHTSILKTVERKWNLPALTFRDANADDLLDSLDLFAPPNFLTPPTLAAPANPVPGSGCLNTGPGIIPPPGYVTGS
jgi:phospholipase C